MPIANTTPATPTWRPAQPTWAPAAPQGTAPLAPNLGRDALSLTQPRRGATGQLPGLPAATEAALEAIEVPEAPALAAEAPAQATEAPVAAAATEAAPDAPAEAVDNAAIAADSPQAAADAAGPEGSTAWWDAFAKKLVGDSVVSSAMRRFQQMEDRMRERAAEQK